MNFVNRRLSVLLTTLLIAGGCGVTGHASDQQPPTTPQAAPAPAVSVAQPFDFATLAKKVVPSVLSVFSTDIIEPGERERGNMPMDPFEFFFGPRMHPFGNRQQEPMMRRSAGSGFFISEDGEVLTNNHVIEDADKIEIELDDGTRYKAELVGRDPATDIAVVKVKEPDRKFPAVALGDSNALQVGEWVMAVGNPLNMDHTVTVGVVSAKGRVLGLADSSFENFIQTDAAINFGNSGGPLLNIRGEVVGINTAINASGQNLGFAVPINAAKRILPQLRDTGSVVRGYLGAQIRNVSPEIQEAFGLAKRQGAFVEEVESGHAADKAGLEHGDTIVAVDGEAVANTRQLIDSVSLQPPGSTVSLEIIRDGKNKKLKVELEKRPSSADEGHTAPASGDASTRAGLAVRELDPRLRQVYGVPDEIDGVVITRVDPVSPAGEEGLVPGDVIQEANSHSVRNSDEFLDAISDVDNGGLLRLYVYRPRAQRSFFAILRMPE